MNLVNYEHSIDESQLSARLESLTINRYVYTRLCFEIKTQVLFNPSWQINVSFHKLLLMDT